MIYDSLWASVFNALLKNDYSLFCSQLVEFGVAYSQKLTEHSLVIGDLTLLLMYVMCVSLLLDSLIFFVLQKCANKPWHLILIELRTM